MTLSAYVILFIKLFELSSGDLNVYYFSYVAGWYEAEVVRVIDEEDTVELKYTDEPECIYSIEVTPSLAEKAIRVKKKYT